jgi:hypothetical protein
MDVFKMGGEGHTHLWVKYTYWILVAEKEKPFSKDP